MKNKLIIAMLALGTMFTSCTDAYDILQDGEQNVDTEVYRTPKDIESGLTFLYSVIPAQTEIALGAIFTDEVSLGISNSGQGLLSGEHNFIMEAGSSYPRIIWQGYYALLNRTNRLIVTTQKLMQEPKANVSEYEKSLGELYLLRAFAHYKLFSYFTEDYTNDTGKSVMILDFVPAGYDVSLPRSTVKEVADFIEADIKRFEALGKGDRANKNYITKEAASAIRVKMATMRKDWNTVLTYGIPLLTSRPLTNSADYQAMFSQGAITSTSSEVIFSLKTDRNANFRPASLFYTNRVARNGSPFFEMSRSLYHALDSLDMSKRGTAYSSDRNDVRYYVNLVSAANNRTGSKIMTATQLAAVENTRNYAKYQEDDIILIGKYRGILQAEMLLSNDIILFRTSDILLSIAEALAIKGDIEPHGVTDLNDPDEHFDNIDKSVYSALYIMKYLRLPQGTPVVMPTLTNGDVNGALQEILKERRVEFAFEGHRYLDIKRIGKKVNKGVSRYILDAQRVAQYLPSTSHMWTLPIPRVEINGNSKINSADQNPGY